VTAVDLVLERNEASDILYVVDEEGKVGMRFLVV